MSWTALLIASACFMAAVTKEQVVVYIRQH